MISYGDLCREGSERLKRAGIAEAELDSRLLLEFLLDMDRSRLLLCADEAAGDKEAAEFRAMIERRSEHVPLQHITGYADFMGLKFRVSKDVLIPRLDTECLVEEAMTLTDDNMSVLDMCTGSGCIIISLARYKNGLKAVGADVSKEAISLARENAELNGVNVDLIVSDGFDRLDKSTDRFDLIVSNPPYIRTSLIDTLMPEVRDHDPHLALDGGEDGLKFYRMICDRAADFLTREGYLLFEIGYDQAGPVGDILDSRGYEDIEVIKDLSGLDRVVRGRNKAFRQGR